MTNSRIAFQAGLRCTCWANVTGCVDRLTFSSQPGSRDVEHAYGVSAVSTNNTAMAPHNVR